MDFKVTGTRDGITALQMDIKVQGINEAIIRDGLKQAYAARLTILDKMAEVLPEARGEMSDFAPRIITIKINPEKIRDIIGKGGSMIRKIQEETRPRSTSRTTARSRSPPSPARTRARRSSGSRA